MDLEKFFHKHPIFTGNELGEYLKTRGSVGPRTQESMLAHKRKAGRVVMVRRGLYAVVPRGADPESYPIDPFLLAARLTRDAVLAYHTALDFSGRAYAVKERFTYLADRPLSPISFRSHVFRGVKFPRSLCRKGQENFGVVSRDRTGLEVRVTSLERTLVDVLDRPDLSGSWEEIWRSLESVEFFDVEKVVEYALLLENATTAAKVGFFLEQHREPLMVEDAHLQPLRDIRPRQPHYIERGKRESGRLVAGWNLVVPGEIVDRSWAEVL